MQIYVSYIKCLFEHIHVLINEIITAAVFNCISGKVLFLVEQIYLTMRANGKGKLLTGPFIKSKKKKNNKKNEN